MKKRIFQKLDELNVEDSEKGSQLVKVSNTLVEAQKVKAGALVGMGVEEAILHEIMREEVLVLLVVINKEEYRRRYPEGT